MICADCGKVIRDDMSIKANGLRKDGTRPPYGLHINCGRQDTPKETRGRRPRLPDMDRIEGSMR